MAYDAYNKNLHCKWCGVVLMDFVADRQCDGCWEVLVRLPDACRIPELFKEIKRLIEKHDDEVRVEENKETQEILQNLGLMEELKQSMKEADAGDVISFEEAEKESFKENEN